MVIDLTNLMIGNVDKIVIDGEVVIDNKFFDNTSIRDLVDTRFCGSVIRLSDNDYQITGVISGNMILPDDITLEDVSYPYEISIEEDFNEYSDDNYLKIIQNRLDITDYLWQNILVEVPSKVKNEKNENLTMEGNGWRLVTEEELKEGNNSPFSELKQMFDSGKE